MSCGKVTRTFALTVGRLSNPHTGQSRNEATMSKRLMHMRDRRLYINAGITFPKCKANAKLLDMSATGLWITYRAEDVTCPKCRKVGW